MNDTHLFIPRFSNVRLTAVMLVHISSFSFSTPSVNPILIRRSFNAYLDSLLVLLQNLNGIPARLRRRSAFTALGMGLSPMWRVPDKSIKMARMNGLALALVDILEG